MRRPGCLAVTSRITTGGGVLRVGFAFLAFLPSWGQPAGERPQNATDAVIHAFDTHNIVMFGESHGCKQEYEWLRGLVGRTGFADRVDDIVVEFGNSLYQPAVDRYIGGEDVPFGEVQQAWRNVIGAIGAPSPVYESFYEAVREANLKRQGKHRIRVVLGDPPGDWARIGNREEWKPFALDRDACYARKVKEEVLAKGRRALLIMGEFHFLREARGRPGLPFIERELRAAGASPYLIIFETRIYDDPQKRFLAWPLPAIVDLTKSWAGDIPLDDGFPGKSPTLAEVADAVLCVAHSRQDLTVLSMTRAELEGTVYARELDRRLMIMTGRHLVLPENAEEPLEAR